MWYGVGGVGKSGEEKEGGEGSKVTTVEHELDIKKCIERWGLATPIRYLNYV